MMIAEYLPNGAAPEVAKTRDGPSGSAKSGSSPEDLRILVLGKARAYSTTSR